MSWREWHVVNALAVIPVSIHLTDWLAALALIGLRSTYRSSLTTVSIPSKCRRRTWRQDVDTLRVKLIAVTESCVATTTCSLLRFLRATSTNEYLRFQRNEIGIAEFAELEIRGLENDGRCRRGGICSIGKWRPSFPVFQFPPLRLRPSFSSPAFSIPPPFLDCPSFLSSHPSDAFKQKWHLVRLNSSGVARNFPQKVCRSVAFLHIPIIPRSAD